MEPMYAWALVIIGLAALVYYAKTKVSLGHPAVVPLVAIALVIAPFAMGWIALPSDTQPITITPTTTRYPEFDVRISSASPTGAANDTGFSSPATTDTDLRALVAPNGALTAIGLSSVYSFNGTAGDMCADQVLNFTFTPVAVGTMDTTTLATLHFKVEHLAKFNGEDVFSERTTGEKDCLFKWGATTPTLVSSAYEFGSYSVAMTDSGYVSLTMVYDTGADSYGEEVYDLEFGDSAATYRITFYNTDNSWSQVYTVTSTVAQDGGGA